METMPTRDQLVTVIHAAIDAGDMGGVVAALKLLAVVAPDDAALILAMLKAAIADPGRRDEDLEIKAETARREWLEGDDA